MARHIDWRRQFKKLQPYLDGKGGVVNVRYRGASCGANAFLSILKADFEHRPAAAKPHGASIRLDPENYKVRYLGGIRSEFGRILGKQSLKTQTSLPTQMVVESDVLSHNSAGGNQHIEANFNFDADAYWAAGRNEWVSLLVSELREHLKTKRFMIVLLMGSSEDQAEFWSSAWNQASELTREGLLLVRMIDEEAQDLRHRFDECEHDCIVTLNAHLDGDDVAHAIEDVTAVILDQDSSGERASAEQSARGYVLGHRHNVSELHSRLLGFMNDLLEF